MTTTTERQVQDLVDRHEITELVHRLGACLDEGRFDDMRTILSSEATAKTPGGEAKGLEAVIAQASRNHSSDERIQHRITDVLIDLDGDEGERATIRANLVVTFVSGSEQSAPRFVMGEVYRFEAIRTAQGWRLSRVETTPLWSTGSR